VIVEHSFVTTLDYPSARAALRRILVSRGWTISLEDQGAFEAVSGAKNPTATRDLHRLPQHLRVEYDRGKVTVGASIIAHRKETPEHSQYLLVVVRALECSVAGGSTNCCAEWDLLIDSFQARADRDRRRSRITVLILVCFLGLVVAAAILAVVVF
jgi:hypothetical protein